MHHSTSNMALLWLQGRTLVLYKRTNQGVPVLLDNRIATVIIVSLLVFTEVVSYTCKTNPDLLCSKLKAANFKYSSCNQCSNGYWAGGLLWFEDALCGS